MSRILATKLDVFCYIIQNNICVLTNYVNFFADALSRYAIFVIPIALHYWVLKIVRFISQIKKIPLIN